MSLERPGRNSGLTVSIATALGLILLATPAAARRGLNVVHRVTVQERGGATTVVIHTSRTPTFTVYKLERPRRLIVDLANSTVKGFEDPVEAETWAVGLITVSRFADAQSALARVVIGFRRPASYQVKAVGTRVLVEVSPAEKPPLRIHGTGRGSSGLTAKAVLHTRADAERFRRQALAQKNQAEALLGRAREALRRAKATAGALREQALREARRLQVAAHKQKLEAILRMKQARAALVRIQNDATRTRDRALVEAARLRAAARREKLAATVAAAAATRLRQEARQKKMLSERLADQAALERRAAARLQRRAASALRRARAMARKTRRQAGALARHLRAEARKLRARASQRLQAASDKKQKATKLLEEARRRLLEAEAMAAETRRRALVKAREVEAIARTRAAKQLERVSRLLKRHHQELARLDVDAARARQAARAAKQKAEASRRSATLARAEATRLKQEAEKYQRSVRRSAAQEKARARRVARAARRRADALEHRSKKMALAARRAEVRAALARKVSLRARSREQATRAEVKRLKGLAARYARAAGLARVEVATLSEERDVMRGEVERLKRAALAARDRLDRARSQAVRARREAKQYRQMAERHKGIMAALARVEKRLARAKRALRAAKDSRRREEARRAVAKAARARAELQLKEVAVARARVQANKSELERRVQILRRRHQELEEAEKRLRLQKAGLARAVREATRERRLAERLVGREKRRMLALVRARRRLEELTHRLEQGVAAQLERKKGIEQAVHEIASLRSSKGSKAQRNLHRLRRSLERLRRTERREARRLVSLRKKVTLAQQGASRYAEALARAKREAIAARARRDRATALALGARQSLQKARRAIAAERQRLAILRRERRALASDLASAEQSLRQVRRMLRKVRRSRVSQERRLSLLRRRLRRGRDALKRLQHRFATVSARAMASEEKARLRLTELLQAITRAEARAKAEAAAREARWQETWKKKQAALLAREQMLTARLQKLRQAALRELRRELGLKRKALSRELAKLKKRVADRRLAARQSAGRDAAWRSERRRLAELEARQQRLQAHLKSLRRKALREMSRELARRRAVLEKRLARERAALESRLARRREALKKQLATLKKQVAAKRRGGARPLAIARRPASRQIWRGKRGRVSRVHFVDGIWAHRIVVDIQGPIRSGKMRQSGRSVTIHLPHTVIPRRLERSLDVSEFDGPVRLVSALRSPRQTGAVDLVVDLRRTAKLRLKKGQGKLYIDVWKTRREVARAKTRRHRRVADRAPGVDITSTRVAAYSAPVTSPAAGSRRALRPYRTYRYGIGAVYTGPRVDMDFNNADIHNVLRLIGRVWRKNIVIAGDVKGNVTIRLQGVRVDRALQVILKTLKLGMVWHSRNLIRVTTEDQIAKELALLEKMREKQRAVEPVYTRVYRLSFAKAQDVAKRIEKNLLSSRGKVTFDERTNLMIVRDVRANLGVIRKMVQTLDTATPQVRIEARIVEARSTFTRDIGIEWGGNAFSGAAYGNPTGLLFPSSVQAGGSANQNSAEEFGATTASNPNLLVNLPTASPAGAIGLRLGSVTGAFNLNLRLSAAEVNGKVRILSKPVITVTDNTEAEIKQGTQLAYNVMDPITRIPTVQFKDAVLSLKVRPHVTNDKRVVLKLNVTNDSPDYANRDATTGNVPIIKQSAQTEMLIKDGDTAVLGGIFQRRSGRTWSKVPWFAEIPIIGWLFKKRTEEDIRTELLIFITPRIVRGGGAGAGR